MTVGRPGVLSSHDWRVAGRSLRRRPGFSIAAIAMLALGLGAATASWSIFDALLLRPLAYPNAERLLLSVVLPGEGVPGVSLSFQEARDIAARAPALESVVGYWDTNSVQSMTPSGPVGVRANFVQGTYLSLLGATPRLGRLLGPDGDRAPLAARG